MSPPIAPPLLDALDDALVAVRRVQLRPGYRGRVLAALDHPIELGALRTLRVVERRGEDATCVGDVAEVLAIDPSTASRAVDRCVAAGWLERTPSRADRRRTELTLSATGRVVLATVTASRRELLAEVTGDWAEGDLAQLTVLLDRLVAAFDDLERGA
jgi:DNA-binding MarR family transcriptional regulator